MFELISKSEKLSVASHGEDLDGLFSAAIIILLHPSELKLKFTAPYEIKTAEESYDMVLDLPPPQGGAKILVDHHESNILLTNRVQKAYLKPEYPSTARLLYDLIKEKEPSIESYERTIALVDETDTGNLDLFSALFTSAIRKIFKVRRKYLASISKDLLVHPPTTSSDLVNLPSIRKETRLIRREYGDLIEKIGSMRGGEALLVKLESVPAYLVPIIQLAAKRYLLFGTITSGSDGALRISIRSQSNSPLSALKVAEAMGGGGHENAAGALIMPSDMDRLLKMIEEQLRVELISV